MPRAGLNQERVIIEAERIVDEVGLPQLTLYKHVTGMVGLQRSISIRAKAELGDVLARAAVGRSGGDAIQAMSGAYRQWALQHPGRYQAAQRAPEPGDLEDEAASAAVVQICADVLVAYDL